MSCPTRHMAIGALVICWCALLPGCATTPDTNNRETQSSLLDPQGNFTLYVSNQSPAADAVDIRIEVDGQMVINEEFDVGDGMLSQHNCKTFKLTLAPGMHKLHVTSTTGEAELSKDFEVTGEHWSVVDYWYAPRSRHNPTPRHFTFHIQDTPIQFE